MFIRLLGGIGAGADAEHVVPAPGRIAAAVLGHLALMQGRLVSTEVLVDAVWEAAPDSARNALQVAVSKLRKLYGADLFEGSRAGYRMRASLVRVDWDEAQRFTQDGRAALERGYPADALATLDAATDLYVGQPFTGWVSAGADAPRLRAEELYSSACLLQAQCHLRLGSPDAAIDLLRVRVAAEPLGEPTHAALMQALTAAGRPGEALEVYDGLRRRLAEELGVDPAPDLRELFGRLLDGTAASGSPSSAAPPRRVPPRGLPTVVSPIVGREREVGRLVQRVRSGHRLVTLQGPGGIGKTRLAIDVAQHVDEASDRSVVFVDLTTVGEPSGVAPAVAASLDVDSSDWAMELHGRQMLIVLDNAEHVLDATREVAEQLLSVPGLTLLVTSRSPLRLRDESVFSVDVLAAEEVDDPAVLLLVDRAGLAPEDVAAQPEDFRALAQRADGVPLVLELLASALRWRTPAELLRHLDSVLLQLTSEDRNRAERHLSVIAVTEWSVRQASAVARTALAALTVPRGSFDLAAATEVISAAVPGGSAAHLLSELLDLSLIQRLPEPGPIRFRMLEPIRMYAKDSELVPQPGADVYRAHAIHFLEAVRRADNEFPVSEEPLAQLLDHDNVNVREALSWLWVHDSETAVGYLGALLFAWYYRDRNGDVLTWSEQVLAREPVPSLAVAEIALARLSVLLWEYSGDQEELCRLSELVVPYVEDFDDEWTRRWISTRVALSRQSGNLDEALGWLDRYPVGDSPRALMRRSMLKVEIWGHAGRPAEAAAELDRVLRSPAIQQESVLLAIMLNGRGYVDLVDGRVESAKPAFERALELCRGQRLVSHAAMIVNNLAWVALESGRYTEAVELVADNFEEPDARTDRLLVGEGAIIVGLALHRLGQEREAKRLALEVTAMTTDADGLLDPYAQRKIAELAAATGVQTEPLHRSRLTEVVAIVQAAAARA